MGVGGLQEGGKDSGKGKEGPKGDKGQGWWLGEGLEIQRGDGSSGRVSESSPVNGEGLGMGPTLGKEFRQVGGFW